MYKTKICRLPRLAFQVAAALLTAFMADAQAASHYAVFLRDAPLAARFSTRAEMQSAAGDSYRAQVESAQTALRSRLLAAHVNVTGAVSTLLNAVFVATTEDRVAEIRAMPGVVDVVLLGRRKMQLNKATTLIGGPAAWSLAGGLPNAGKGIKIAVLDTGVDQNHPSLQDSTLSPPPGFPKCNQSNGDCAYTNSKVIVARSYVSITAAGSDPNNPAVDSRPDDFSPRDHQGHGTAVATAAAGNPSGIGITINGMAPKAFIGNYKIGGSPEVNDFASDDAMIAALNDAVADGMDMVSLSFGGAALSGPTDVGPGCNDQNGAPIAAGVPCDPLAFAFEAAAQKGMVIVTAAGNEGANGALTAPTFGTVGTPANAPSVIAVGATSNSHAFMPTVQVPSGPANLQNITAQPTVDSQGFQTAVFADAVGPMVDLTTINPDGLGCSALPGGSLSGAIALILRGTCNFSVKLANAVAAGALGVVFYDAPNCVTNCYPFSPSGITNTLQPAVFISNADGVSLKSFVDSNPTATTRINLSGIEVPISPFNQMTYYSSAGPTAGLIGLKPDVVAPGAGGFQGDYIYMGAQSYDPLGIMYSGSGYIQSAGTSFSTPLVTGSAALVKQAHPGWTAAQIRSALINTATSDVTSDDQGFSVNVMQTGAGKVAADLAVQSNATIAPAIVSFGALASGTVSKTQAITITNAGSGGALNLTLALVQTSGAATVTPALDKTTLTIAASASATVNLSLSGTAPAAGLYSGVVNIQGAAVALHVPYSYMVGSNNVGNIYTVQGDGTDGSVNQVLTGFNRLGFQVTDFNGVPIAGTPVTFAATQNVSFSNVSTVTDAYGIAYATATLGPNPGLWAANGCVGACTRLNFNTTTFGGSVRAVPTIFAGGVVAYPDKNQPVSPGSYISIYGSALSDIAIDQTSTARLPLAMDNVIVTFDVPSAGLSFPGHIQFITPGQVNVQVPWELQGQTSVQIKLAIGYQSNSNVITVPVAAYAPAFFEYPIGSGATLAFDGNYKLISPSNPAKQGSTIAFYASGLGPVVNGPPSGDPASTTVFSKTTGTVTAIVGGQPATVTFAGLAPGFAGVYQVNVTVPPGIGAGIKTVTISIAGQTSKTETIVVQ
jgi:uncharacterized protein (TIGR03437 family)